MLVITQTASHAISGPKAAELAGITYRQLDYWARQGWVRPSLEAGVGRPGRRIYHRDDVVKLAALGHFGRSGADVGQLGPAIGRLDLSSALGDYLVVATGGSELELVEASQLRPKLQAPGFYCVFDPGPVRTRMSAGRPAASRSVRSRRTA